MLQYESIFHSLVSTGRERYIHLIELESVLLAGTIGRYQLVAIQDIIDKTRPRGLGQASSPFDQAHRTERKKRRPEFKVPSLCCGVNIQYSEATSLSQIAVLVRRQMQVGIAEPSKISAPSAPGDRSGSQRS